MAPKFHSAAVPEVDILELSVKAYPGEHVCLPISETDSSDPMARAEGKSLQWAEISGDNTDLGLVVR
ncbi:uncharacterized protein PG986_013089 [Apiospora aurea]|uniref:Uncharacterized protein n=1 Tax=Apiospora aurea TaxID=335848 RepID=A0ABR1Q1T5_9PEZI